MILNYCGHPWCHSTFTATTVIGMPMVALCLALPYTMGRNLLR